MLELFLNLLTFPTSPNDKSSSDYTFLFFFLILIFGIGSIGYYFSPPKETKPKTPITVESVGQKTGEVGAKFGKGFFKGIWKGLRGKE